MPWFSSKFRAGIDIGINLLQKELKKRRKKKKPRLQSDILWSLRWPHLRWPKVLNFTVWGTMTGSSRKFGFFYIQEHVNVTQDRQYVGVGETTCIWYNYILLTPEISDPNINNLMLFLSFLPYFLGLITIFIVRLLRMGHSSKHFTQRWQSI